MPQFNDALELMQFSRSDELMMKCEKRNIDYESILFTAVTIREYAVDIALEYASKGYVPNRCLMMIYTDDTHHRKNIGLSFDQYWKEAESSINKCRKQNIDMCDTVSTIWGSPVGGGYATDITKAYDFVEKWLELGATSIEHADHDGSASANEVY